MFRYFAAALLSLAIVFSVRSSAQEVLYTPYEKFDFRTDDYAVVGLVNGKFIDYRNNSDGPILEIYNDSMNKEATILLDFIPGKVYQIKFITYTDQIIVLYQSLEGNKVTQYAAMLDAEGRLKSKPIELGSAKTSIFGAMKTYFYTVVSEDKKRIFVYTISNKTHSFAIVGKWIDEQLEVMNRSEVEFKTDDVVYAADLNVDNSGTVYLAAFTTLGVQNYADQYWLLSLKQGDSKLMVHTMDFGDRFGTSGYLKIDNIRHKVYFGGFYSSKKNGKNEGVIYAIFDGATEQFETIKFLPFSNELLAQLSNVGDGHAFDNFNVLQVIVKNDGGFVVIAERQFVTTRTNYLPTVGYYSMFYSPMTSSSAVREYHYDEIIALAYDQAGNNLWNKVVPKRQYSQEDEGLFSSYLMLNSGSSLVFLFNDFNDSHSKIQMANLKPEGLIEYNYFTSDAADYPDWIPRAGKQIAARELIVPCLHKKQLCFARVRF